ncbi:hypothetical protein IVZ55_13725 [Salmonella enterica subsp. enterica serovar Worthington]|nr:hypothetical protein [Salmonella enterica subsp. enterica serovar Worthington]MBP1523625.1 hypothetical protein [Salmonella enterica subsp. enterica serovar Worthington]MBP1524689.1 hypothetical protein [Salmonella enterica subsp. enterica serovar Worthington]
MSNLKQQAESGLSTIEDAVIEFVKQHPEGVSNKQIAVELGLESDIEGKHTNYLSWSILGIFKIGSSYPSKERVVSLDISPQTNVVGLSNSEDL